jgi:hypothetical protein
MTSCWSWGLISLALGFGAGVAYVLYRIVRLFRESVEATGGK